MRTPAQWLRRVRRREAGVYAYRTDRHLRRGREWAYVGESLHLAQREKDHAGVGRYAHRAGQCPSYPRPCSHMAKRWMDLRPRRYVLVRLPWFLAFSWITRSIETVLILMLRPRYNWAKNPRAGKVGPRGQAAQRQLRDDLGQAAIMPAGTAPATWAWRVITLAIIVTGVVIAVVTR